MYLEFNSCIFLFCSSLPTGSTSGLIKWRYLMRLSSLPRSLVMSQSRSSAQKLLRLLDFWLCYDFGELFELLTVREGSVCHLWTNPETNCECIDDQTIYYRLQCHICLQATQLCAGKCVSHAGHFPFLDSCVFRCHTDCENGRRRESPRAQRRSKRIGVKDGKESARWGTVVETKIATASHFQFGINRAFAEVGCAYSVATRTLFR